VLFAVTVPVTAKYFLVQQLTTMALEGWDVHLACSPDGDYEELRKIPGITLHAIPTRREPSPLFDVLSLFRWHRLMSSLKPDIVVGSTPKAALLSMIAGWVNHIPVRVYHARGLRAQGLKGVFRQLSITTERITVRCSTTVLCDSDSLRLAMMTEKCISPGSGVVLGLGSCCGVDVAHFRPPTDLERTSARAKFGFTDSDVVVGFVGRITTDKGIKELIGAIEKARLHNQNIKLALFGPHEDPSIKAPLAREAPSIHFFGETADSRYAYWAMDIFTLPSYREGFPIASLEAQACGLPLITTTTTGCVDSQPPTAIALTVPVKDQNALNAAIQALATAKDERLKFGAQARNWVTAHFDSRVVQARQIKFLSELLEESNSTGI
jgi:glycosyltransferase involved in cell wall biosynthesis